MQTFLIGTTALVLSLAGIAFPFVVGFAVLWHFCGPTHLRLKEALKENDHSIRFRLVEAAREENKRAEGKGAFLALTSFIVAAAWVGFIAHNWHSVGRAMGL